jgi:hypothetical protein
MKLHIKEENNHLYRITVIYTHHAHIKEFSTKKLNINWREISPLGVIETQMNEYNIHQKSSLLLSTTVKNLFKEENFYWNHSRLLISTSH